MKKKTVDYGIKSLLCGLFSIVLPVILLTIFFIFGSITGLRPLWWVVFTIILTYYLPIYGIVYAYKGLKQGENGFNTVGLILSIIGLLMPVILLVVGGIATYNMMMKM